MPNKYYLDTCIWLDYWENRKDKFRPLGEWALGLVNKIIKDKDIILYSEVVEIELRKRISEHDIKNIFSILPRRLLIKINISESEKKEAYFLSKKTRVYFNDVLHAILARNHGAVLVTRDKHFLELNLFLNVKKPEDLL
ncbi:MAG: PIN domain-containing protein [Nanoarchaeota archaeon]|nr:PIN domain-containing protein [Nanoarchaeota archaeon]MBU1321621.1 PIN domain-containing protein [Nanoarchaeota archaeon]MBU1597405.1 PIN domain-containing protein [Nanoarchaeota archaeon]MBU2440932.1 PIN domain-containing protein [Nanoarchaeota archaeon]